MTAATDTRRRERAVNVAPDTSAAPVRLHIDITVEREDGTRFSHGFLGTPDHRPGLLLAIRDATQVLMRLARELQDGQ